MGAAAAGRGTQDSFDSAASASHQPTSIPNTTADRPSLPPPNPGPPLCLTRTGKS